MRVVNKLIGPRRQLRRSGFARLKVFIIGASGNGKQRRAEKAHFFGLSQAVAPEPETLVGGLGSSDAPREVLATRGAVGRALVIAPKDLYSNVLRAENPRNHDTLGETDS